MKLTDKQALREQRLVNSADLDESVSNYPEDERDGRSDLQFIADEVSYLISCYEEDGHVLHDDLWWARDILRETNNGKFIPLTSSLKPKYRPSDITTSRNVINEYRRLKSCMKRLNAKGIYGRW